MTIHPATPPLLANYDVMANFLIKDLRAIAKGFSKDLDEWPHIPCPTCKRGSLLPVPDSFVKEEAATSASWHEHEGWEPDWIRGGFHCLLACRRSSCDLVRVMGEMNVVWTGNHEDDVPYETLFTPTIFLPALPMIESRDLCPSEVGERVDAAAKILWLDPNAAANRIRAAVETLMDDQGIIRKDVDRRGRVIKLTLDRRIAIFKTERPQHSEAADLILAVKWIGNVGSHDDVLRIPDVLNGVEFLDHALSLIYNESRDEVRKRASEVTARKGRPESFSVQVPF